MAKEKVFYEWLKKTFPHWDFQRIETSTGSGVPDCHIVAVDPDSKDPPQEFWAELKALPKTNIQIRKEQYSWIEKRSRKGAQTWIFNRDPKNKTVQVFRSPLFIETGRKNHVKLVSEPLYDLACREFKKLKAKDFQ